MIYSKQFENNPDYFMFQPEITPEVIEVCTKQISEGTLAGLGVEDEKAFCSHTPAFMNTSAFMDTLENIVLEADSDSYEKFKPELENILMKLTGSHQQAIINFSDEVVKLLHLSYKKNKMHSLEQSLMEAFEAKLAFQFSPWNIPQDDSDPEDKYADEIPWDNVFKSMSAHVRSSLKSMINDYKDRRAKLCMGHVDQKDAFFRHPTLRTKALIDLKKKMKKDEENRSAIKVEFDRSISNFLKNHADKMDDSNSNHTCSTKESAINCGAKVEVD